MKAWKLFRIVYECGEEGVDRDQIHNKIWPRSEVTPNTLDQHKQAANNVLEILDVSIELGPGGIWRLERF